MATSRDFPHAGITIFMLFFAGSLLDAMNGRHWVRVAVWIGAGLLFLALEGAFRNRAKRKTHDSSPGNAQ